MELVSINSASLTSLFAVARSTAPPYLADMTKAVVERYRFLKFPTVDDVLSNNIKFLHGTFEGNSIDALEIYHDGVVVRARCNTRIIDAFFEDAVEWFDKTTNGRRVETHSVSRMYESNLSITGNEGLLAALDAIESIGQMVSKLLKDSSGGEFAYQPFGISLAPDTALIPGTGLKPIPFRVERRLGLEYKLNHFISSAPLRTDDHLKVLRRLEDLT